MDVERGGIVISTNLTLVFFERLLVAMSSFHCVNDTLKIIRLPSLETFFAECRRHRKDFYSFELNNFLLRQNKN